VKVSDRLKAKDLAGSVVVLKLKRRDFRLLTRRRSLHAATQLADVIYREGAALLEGELGAGPFRLIGIGVSGLGGAAPDAPDLLDPGAQRRAQAERAVDAIRGRFGPEAIGKGRGLRDGR
jgi:DNA polymerase-4